MCDGAPAYQKGGGDGPVLHRSDWMDATQWQVGNSSVLETCKNYPNYLRSFSRSWSALGAGGPPTAQAYTTGDDGYGTGWVDLESSPHCTADCGISIFATGGQ